MPIHEENIVMKKNLVKKHVILNIIYYKLKLVKYLISTKFL